MNTTRKNLLLFLVSVVVFGVCMTLTAFAVGEPWYISLFIGFMSIVAVIMTCLGSDRFRVWVQACENRK